MALTLTEPLPWAYYSRNPLVYTARETDSTVSTIKWVISLRQAQSGGAYETITLSTQPNNFDRVHLDVAAVMRGSIKDDGHVVITNQTRIYPDVTYPKPMSKTGIYWLSMTVTSQDADGSSINSVSSSTDRLLFDGYQDTVTSLADKDANLDITNADVQGWLTDRDMSVQTYTMNRTLETLPCLAFIRMREYDDEDPDNPNIKIEVNDGDGTTNIFITDGDLAWDNNAWSNRVMYKPQIDDAEIYAEKTTGDWEIGDDWVWIRTYLYMTDSRRSTAIKINNIGCHNSKTNPLHLMWQNSKGGVDDVVFEGHTETSQSVKEKRYQQGIYSTFTETATINTGAGSVRYYAEAEQTIKATGVALTADDRRILQYAYKSPRVWYRIVDGSSTWQPCTLQGSYAFDVAKSRLKEVSITLKPDRLIVC